MTSLGLYQVTNYILLDIMALSSVEFASKGPMHRILRLSPLIWGVLGPKRLFDN